MMKASISLVFGLAATVAVLITTPVAAQPWRLDNPYGWIDRFKAESAAKWQAELAQRRQRDQEAKQEAERSAQEIERERLKAREAEAEQRAAEARKRYAEDRRHAAEARRRAVEAAATTKRGLQFSFFSFRFGGGKSEVERIAKLSPQSEPQSSAPHNRDPDGIYQFGQQVGTVELPQIDKSKSTVFFQRIVGAMNLNNDREFEYRKYVLHIRGELGETTSDLSGQRDRTLFAVLCDIVGPASTASISR
jgi:hypothetical protein